MTKRKTPALPTPAPTRMAASTPRPTLGGPGPRPTAQAPVDAAAGPNAAAGPLGARKPMARATRITLFEREVHERLSRAALDIVFARAELLSEGQRTVRGGQNGYVGSTMLTIDLAVLGDVLRDPCDAGTAHRLAALMDRDAALPRRIHDIGAREATRVAGAPLTDIRTQMVVRAQGAKVFIDIDVEAGL